MSEKRLKTRCYYTEYVNHMIRFYITCPDTIKTDGKRRADIENWVAVQGGLHCLPEEDRVRVLEIYKTHYNLPQAVKLYCEKTGTDINSVWMLITKAASIIAKYRGLV